MNAFKYVSGALFQFSFILVIEIGIIQTIRSSSYAIETYTVPTHNCFTSRLDLTTKLCVTISTRGSTRLLPEDKAHSVAKARYKLNTANDKYCDGSSVWYTCVFLNKITPNGLLISNIKKWHKIRLSEHFG